MLWPCAELQEAAATPLACSIEETTQKTDECALYVGAQQ